MSWTLDKTKEQLASNKKITSPNMKHRKLSNGADVVGDDNRNKSRFDHRMSMIAAHKRLLASHNVPVKLDNFPVDIHPVVRSNEAGLRYLFHLYSSLDVVHETFAERLIQSDFMSLSELYRCLKGIGLMPR